MELVLYSYPCFEGCLFCALVLAPLEQTNFFFFFFCGSVFVSVVSNVGHSGEAAA
jgi:hypothetical protein